MGYIITDITKVAIIYGVSCVCARVKSQKHCFLRCFVASADPNFLLAKVKNCGFYVVFGSAEGSGKEKLASWRSFNRDGLTYRQHSLNIGHRLGQHGANIGSTQGQHRVNTGPTWAKIGPR